MPMRKYGAPATSHVRLITAEDIPVLEEAASELSKTEAKDDKEEEQKKDEQKDNEGN